MTISQFFNLVRSRAGTIAAVFSASVLLGLAVFALPPKIYQVSMIMEVRLTSVGPYSRALPDTIKNLMDRGVFNKEIALKAGLKENEPLPRLEVKVIYSTQLLKVYAFVKGEQIERTKGVMNAMVEVLRDKFPAENAAYFTRVSRLNEQAERFLRSTQDIDPRLKHAQPALGIKKLAGDLTTMAGGLSELELSAADMLKEGGTLHAYGVRTVIPPAAESSPVAPTLPQTLLAFGLLGFFAGLAAAFWAEEHESQNKNRGLAIGVLPVK